MNPSGETLDVLCDGRLTLYQSRSGYRFSIDTLLLAAYVSIKRGDRVVDLGTGNGVIPLVLAQRHASAAFVGVELQSAMVERARRNVCLNELDARIRIVGGDVRRPRTLAPPASFDVAVCNPPYRKPSSGRISPDHERQIARHELTAGLNDFLHAGAFLVREKGQMALVYPAVRSTDLIFALRQARLEPKRLRAVHSFHGTEASLLLVEAVKGGRAGLKILPPLILYREAQRLTAEAAAILAGLRP